MRRIVFIVVVSSLVLLLLTAMAAAAPVERPFKGCMTGTISFSPGAPEPPYLWVTSAATGPASHLGAAVMSAVHAAGYVFAGDMTFTAADGDTLTCTYAGNGAIPPDIDVGDWYETTSTNTITGGTGRFAGASGHFDMTGSLQFMGFGAPNWPAVWRWSGTIEY